MTTSRTCITWRGSARVAVAGAILLAAVHGAAADDAGVHEFFSSLLPGGAGHSAAAPARVEPSRADPGDRPTLDLPRRVRPLMVHLQQPRIVVAQGPTKPATVSIFEDRTLRPGDAVMTAQGIRVFAGSPSWPYTSGDFVRLDAAGRFSGDTSKALAQLDRMPRG